MALMRGKVDGAMEGGFGPGAAVEWAEGSPNIPYDTGFQSAGFETASYQPSGPLAREFHAGQPVAASAPRSMAETLQAAFGASDTAASGHVREAYSKLARLGL
jgi:hypothetical protein